MARPNMAGSCVVPTPAEACGAPLPALDRRRAGVLLHLSSLGPGALGAPARAWIDWLADAGFSVWQILPVGPTGPDGSPYWVGSDHAGHPAFIDRGDLPEATGPDYDAFRAGAAHWLDDYALYAALRDARWGADWSAWSPALREREPRALRAARSVYSAAIETTCREQYAFDVQWRALRAHAAARGVRLFGDLPIYVAPGAVEVWAHREQFRVDDLGRCEAVAGVPPDYFSDDGQLWGNPLYDWTRMRADGFAYWRRRIAAQLARFDLLRLDHFRGLAAHWAVPAGARTAREGHWEPTPGLELLDALRRDRTDLPFVAENLGDITPDVEELRRRFDLPGMHVLQFGFGGAGDNPHLPHMHERCGVVYTGTHDNDTTRGWVGSLDGETLRRVEFYLGATDGDVAAAMLRAALGSVCRLAVLPMQDLLGLGSEARLNTPGTTVGNWSWMLPVGAVTRELARRCSLLNRAYGRA
jgi:4-alpha-glucanotransferase